MIHLDLQPEVEAQLAAEASALGLSLDRYVETIVTDHSREAGTDTFYSCDQKLSEQQLAANLRQGLADIAEGRMRSAEECLRSCTGSMAYRVRLADGAVTDDRRRR